MVCVVCVVCVVCGVCGRDSSFQNNVFLHSLWHHAAVHCVQIYGKPTDGMPQKKPLKTGAESDGPRHLKNSSPCQGENPPHVTQMHQEDFSGVLLSIFSSMTRLGSTDPSESCTYSITPACSCLAATTRDHHISNCVKSSGRSHQRSLYSAQRSISFPNELPSSEPEAWRPQTRHPGARACSGHRRQRPPPHHQSSPFLRTTVNSSR